MKHPFNMSTAWVYPFAVLCLLSLSSCQIKDKREAEEQQSQIQSDMTKAEDRTSFRTEGGFATGETASQPRTLRIMSYNVENLFDTLDDPDTEDEDFTPGGYYKWNNSKYQKKLRQLASVISDLGEWDFPALVGLVEVENLEVVMDLVKADPIRKADYRLGVSRGADPRGIDVALLWNPKNFRQVEAYEIPHYGNPLYYPLRRDPRTKRERWGKGRSSLWVVLEEKSSGELYDVIVVHLPSRRGGTRSTSEKREEVNGKINRVLDVIERERETPRIILMGDLNDSPGNISVRDSLRSEGVKEAHGSFRRDHLYNLASGLEERGLGTHYFDRSLWLPDQIMVSGALLDPRSHARFKDEKEVIFSPKYMVSGKGPKRSFKGPRFVSSGFSDHFPVYADLTIE